MKTKILKTNLLLVAITLLLLITACGCVKDNIQNNQQDELPPITQTGENTFGCTIDGEVLIPKDGKPIGPPGSSPRRGVIFNWPTVEDFSFRIEAINAWNDGGDYIYIYIYNLTKEGVYQLGDGKNAYDIIYRQPVVPNPQYHFIEIAKSNENNKIIGRYSSYENSGSVTITRFDSENNIYSGTFNLKAVNRDDPTDIIEITDGRFDFDINKPFNFK
jgi:hypothetical protein